MTLNAKTAVTINDITIDKINTITATAGTTMSVGDITVADADGFTLTLNGVGAIQDGGATDYASIVNSAGGITVDLNGTATASTTEIVVEANSSLTTDTDVDILIDAAGWSGTKRVSGTLLCFFLNISYSINFF